MSDSEIKSLLNEFRKLRSAEDFQENPNNSNMAMTNEQLKAIIEGAVARFSRYGSFDTRLNFKAIINRLDFTYADKRPVYL